MGEGKFVFRHRWYCFLLLFCVCALYVVDGWIDDDYDYGNVYYYYLVLNNLLVSWLVFDCNRINFEWIWKWTKKKNEILNRWSNQINDILLLFSLSFLNIFDIHSISLITSSLCVYVFIHLPFFLFSLMEKFFFFVHSSKRKKDFKSITIKYEKKESERDIYGKPGNVKYIISNVWLKERKN